MEPADVDIPQALRWAAQNFNVDRVTAEVTQAFNAAGVESILLKGPTIAAWFYANDRLRFYADLDFLIRRCDCLTVNCPRVLPTLLGRSIGPSATQARTGWKEPSPSRCRFRRNVGRIGLAFRWVNVRDILREVAWRTAPGLMADRAIRWQFAHHPEPSNGWTVEAGPLEGLCYPEGLETVNAANLKQQGQYETEIAGAIAAALRLKPQCFVDIGAAEGYYAVFAASLGVPTIAYESSSIQRNALRRVAEVNGVKLDIRKHCRRVPHISPNTLLLMDVEGAEEKLLDRGGIERLRGSTAIIELHEPKVLGIAEILRERFGGTHQFRVIESKREEPGRSRGLWAVCDPLD